MNVIMLLDDVLINYAKRFESHRNILDAKYFSVSKNLYLSPSNLVNLSNYMIHSEPEDENCPIYKKLMTN